jgi:hypothetical protein
MTEDQITAAARALSNDNADICNVNREDNWMLYGDSFRETAKIALEAAFAEFDNPENTGVGTYCQPGDQSEPRWLLKFDDAERGACVYETEQEAREAFAHSEGRGWNCWLFSPTPRALASNKAPPQPVPAGGYTPVNFVGINPLKIAEGACLPMIPDSWRFGFRKTDTGFDFSFQDDGPLVAWEAVKEVIASNKAAAVAVGIASALPGAEAWTITVCRAEDVPVGTKLYTAAVKQPSRAD